MFQHPLNAIHKIKIFTIHVLEFEVKGKRKRGRLRKTWRSQVEKESKSVGLKKEDAKNRARFEPPSIIGIKPDQNLMMNDDDDDDMLL